MLSPSQCNTAAKIQSQMDALAKTGGRLVLPAMDIMLDRGLELRSGVELAGQGARVQAHDPAVKKLPAELDALVTLLADPVAALAGADALVVATEWQAYLAVDPAAVRVAMAAPRVVDANRFLAKTLGSDSQICYVTVGKVLP